MLGSGESRLLLGRGRAGVVALACGLWRDRVRVHWLGICLVIGLDLVAVIGVCVLRVLLGGGGIRVGGWRACEGDVSQSRGFRIRKHDVEAC